jgi:hypothetical protein
MESCSNISKLDCLRRSNACKFCRGTGDGKCIRRDNPRPCNEMSPNAARVYIAEQSNPEAARRARQLRHARHVAQVARRAGQQAPHHPPPGENGNGGAGAADGPAAAGGNRGGHNAGGPGLNGNGNAEQQPAPAPALLQRNRQEAHGAPRQPPHGGENQRRGQQQQPPAQQPAAGGGGRGARNAEPAAQLRQHDRQDGGDGGRPQPPSPLRRQRQRESAGSAASNSAFATPALELPPSFDGVARAVLARSYPALALARGGATNAAALRGFLRVALLHEHDDAAAVAGFHRFLRAARGSGAYPADLTASQLQPLVVQDVVRGLLGLSGDQ